MGNANFRQWSQGAASQDPKQFLHLDLPKFDLAQVNQMISKGKFMKTFSGKINETNVVVKVVLNSIV